MSVRGDFLVRLVFPSLKVQFMRLGIGAKFPQSSLIFKSCYHLLRTRFLLRTKMAQPLTILGKDNGKREARGKLSLAFLYSLLHTVVCRLIPFGLRPLLFVVLDLVGGGYSAIIVYGMEVGAAAGICRVKFIGMVA